MLFRPPGLFQLAVLFALLTLLLELIVDLTMVVVVVVVVEEGFLLCVLLAGFEALLAEEVLEAVELTSETIEKLFPPIDRRADSE